jgi:DNA-binding CsgD family transcriptional regulator
MSPPIARQLLQRLAPAPSSAAGGPAIPMQSMLTEREHEILLILSRGYTYAEAARLSGIAVSTVQSHVKNIYNKLNVGSKTEAVFEARQLGLL